MRPSPSLAAGARAAEPMPGPALRRHALRFRERGVRSAQNMQVGPRIPVEMQLEKAAVGPTSGPTWRLSHFSMRGLPAADDAEGCVVHAPPAAEQRVEVRHQPAVAGGGHCRHLD
jgi:hypothetical protein